MVKLVKSFSCSSNTSASNPNATEPADLCSCKSSATQFGDGVKVVDGGQNGTNGCPTFNVSCTDSSKQLVVQKLKNFHLMICYVIFWIKFSNTISMEAKTLLLVVLWAETHCLDLFATLTQIFCLTMDSKRWSVHFHVKQMQINSFIPTQQRMIIVCTFLFNNELKSENKAKKLVIKLLMDSEIEFFDINFNLGFSLKISDF